MASTDVGVNGWLELKVDAEALKRILHHKPDFLTDEVFVAMTLEHLKQRLLDQMKEANRI